MKIEKINENKIKVTISINDLEERNIDLDSLNYNSPAAQELFKDMMEQAEIEFGFSAAETDSHLVFEAFQNSEDGFVVTITKLDDEGDFESIHKYIKNKYKNTDLKTRKKNKRIYSTLLIYHFSSFDDICSLCKAIRNMYAGESTIYKYKTSYYLILTRNNLTLPNPKAFEALLNEYGSKLSNASFYDGYLSEYGTKIAEGNAIEVINQYF